MDLRIPLVALVGTVVSWYSFFSVGILSASQSPFHSLILSALFYFSAFVGRPVGAYLLGRLGDKLGKRFSLSLVFLFLFVGDLLISLRSPLLIISPILIGLALGGEWGNASVLVAESVESMRGGWTSVVQLSVPLGLLLSLTVILSPLSLLVPSLVSAFLIPAILRLPEPRGRLTGAQLSGIRSLMKGIMIKAGESSNFYLFTSFSIPFLVKAGLDLGTLPVLLVSVEEIFLMIPMGIASDLMGRRKVIRTGMLLMLISSGLLSVSVLVRSPVLVFASFLLFGVGDTLSYAPQGAYLSELYRAEERVMMTGLAYQLSAVLAGGTSILLTSISLSFLGERGGLLAIPLLSLMYVTMSVLSV
ncbi:putative sialic acid transporter [Metallosphaera sp. J1]|uniref:MFS transporter n=1 Tax=Metallosphaera javensis (ex Hofmann et al. 2022) TaxID=99938 RepID=UPI001EE052AE|nr:MFS transporter [Metallosphaera javensis (ex Hofmann et al. 2022)]MCG3109685.1 putative sialic acid transporter [Metallosphaera javensis (ex Hofmann et al. 2022)]